MNCNRLEALLMEYMDGRLPDRERTEVAERLTDLAVAIGRAEVAKDRFSSVAMGASSPHGGFIAAEAEAKAAELASAPAVAPEPDSSA